jgi:signal transduction histidine kinase
VVRAPVPVKLSVKVGPRPPEQVEVAAYFMVSGCLTNVAKYAHASAASVNVVRTNGELVVKVTDDGVGGATGENGSGLRGLADRVEALVGHLHVTSPGGRRDPGSRGDPVREALAEDGMLFREGLARLLAEAAGVRAP